MKDSIFPTYQSGHEGAACNTTFRPVGGITLRDLFAMAALNAIAGLSRTYDDETCNKHDDAADARAAYACADAMLAAREAKASP